MEPFYVLGIQSTLSTITFALLVWWYLLPRLRSVPVHKAAAPLLWINVFRYAPLVLFAPGQVSDGISTSTRSLIAYGDTVAGLTALLALVLLRYRVRGAIAATWLFVGIGIADSLTGIVAAMRAHAYLFPLGTSWFIVAFYVPLTMVSQLALAYWLIAKPRQDAAA